MRVMDFDARFSQGVFQNAQKFGPLLLIDDQVKLGHSNLLPEELGFFLPAALFPWLIVEQVLCRSLRWARAREPAHGLLPLTSEMLGQSGIPLASGRVRCATEFL